MARRIVHDDVDEGILAAPSETVEALSTSALWRPSKVRYGAEETRLPADDRIPSWTEVPKVCSQDLNEPAA
jgi:hypothetical protein